jgi:hypothetical protein
LARGQWRITDLKEVSRQGKESIKTMEIQLHNKLTMWRKL